MRGSEFAALRAFVNVVDHKNFARAAEQLRISASTLSETIRELEGRIGVRLLNRTTRSVSMTDAGMRLYARFKPALGEMEAAVQDIANLRSRPAGTLRLHIPRLAAMTYLEPILGPFHRAYPDIVLDVTVDDAVTDIVAAGYDIGVRLGELLDNDVVAFKLSGDFREVAVASPDYVARHGRPDAPADLLHHSCINWRQPGRTELYKWEFYRDGRWCAVAVDGPLVVSHRDLALAAALQGVGIAFWAEFRVRALIDEGRLVPLLEDWSGTYPGWHLYYPKQRYTPSTVRAFADFMRRSAEALPGGPDAGPVTAPWR